MGYETTKNRRDFLRALGCTVAAGGASAFIPQMNLLSAALAATTGFKNLGGHKALVCLYLSGGNDSFNLLMPRDGAGSGTAYDTYRQSRGGVYSAASNAAGLAVDFANSLPINAAAGGSFGTSGAYGLHPECLDRAFTGGANAPAGTTPGLKSLFDSNRLAFFANIGTLVQPISKTQYNSGVARPPQLFSHNDQTTQWNLGRTDSNWQQGWGGMVAANVLQNSTQTSALSPCISLAGNARFLVGKSIAASSFGQPITPYQMSANGATQLGAFTGTPREAALNELLAASASHAFAGEAKAILSRAKDLAITLTDTLSHVDGRGRITTPYQNVTPTTQNPAANIYNAARVTVGGTTYTNTTLDQLRMVARMIKASRIPAAGINAERQIFFVNLGGFDSHDSQMVNTTQPLLMARLSQAVGWFWQAMNEISAQNDVTLFSMSEFARTLSSNGNGSDHAWGGVQFAMGGAVNGGKIYGKYPSLRMDANDNTSSDWSFARGQFIPTTAVDQFASTLATWMGVPSSALSGIFPNIGNFNNNNLGFLN